MISVQVWRKAYTDQLAESNGNTGFEKSLYRTAMLSIIVADNDGNAGVENGLHNQICY